MTFWKGFDIERGFVVLMGVPRALWHWHGTDNRLVRFGAPVECSPLITITRQSGGGESQRRTRGAVMQPLSLQEAPTNINYGSPYWWDLYVCCNQWSLMGVLRCAVLCCQPEGGREGGACPWWTIVLPARARRSRAGTGPGKWCMPAVEAWVTAGQGLTAKTGGGCQGGILGGKMGSGKSAGRRARSTFGSRAV